MESIPTSSYSASRDAHFFMDKRDRRKEPELVHGYLRARHMSDRAAASFSAICEAIAGFALLP